MPASIQEGLFSCPENGPPQDAVLLDCYRLEVTELVALIRQTQTSIAKFDTVIANISRQSVASLLEAGAFATRSRAGDGAALICCLGKWRPLPECGGVQCDSGIAPVTVATGRTRIIQSVEPVRNFYAKHFMNGRSIQ
jgi:hypothetical protein